MIDKENIILENFIEKYPCLVNIDNTELILKQMENCVCRIKCGITMGTGFFTKIKKIPFLITNNHVLKKDEIISKKEIQCFIGREKNLRSIKYDGEKRKIFENKDLDYTFIEITEEDDIYENNFLQIDEDLEERKNYNNHPIYILGYPYPNRKDRDDEIYVSYGIINAIRNSIVHSCSTNKGSSGSPILSLKTFKIIGYHFGYLEEKEKNVGIFIKDALDSCSNQIEELCKKDEMNIIYKINNNPDKIRIFGKEFVKNNKKLKIIVQENEKDISEFIETNEDIKNKGELEVKLKDINNITNMSHLFSGCIFLKNIKIHNFNRSITNINNIFNDCSSLESLSKEISLWDISQIKDMSFMFRNCSSLTRLPDLSEWKTWKVTNMEGIFSGCKSLNEIKGIQKWATDEVTNMKKIFSGCSSLKSLPDISSWNTQKVEDMGGIFTGCLQLTTLPDISKWDTGKVKDMSEMFSICNRLSNLPDIYKWNTIEVKSMRGMFSGCNKLESINLIYKWETKNVEDMSQMFRNCSYLKDVQDIYKWDVSKVKNMSYMFYGCKEPKSLPHISIWNVKEANTYKIDDDTNLKIPSKLKGDCSIY